MVLLLRLFLIFVLIEKISQTLEALFLGYPNTSNFLKNAPLHVVFSTLFSVFGCPDETLSLVFDVIFQKRVRVFHRGFQTQKN